MPRRTTHKITTERSGSVNGMDFDAEYEITFTFLDGAPEQGPSYAHGGQPADPDEIEFVSVKPVIGVVDAGAFTDLAQKDLDDWATDWLQEDGFGAAVSLATDERFEDSHR
jgi:hypothetical protein